MNRETVFAIRKWCVQRGSHVNIKNLNLDVYEGTSVALMGPSGVGKTTLLMTLLGYRDASIQLSGVRYYEGRQLADDEVPNNALYIPQHQPFNPNWEITGYLCRLPWGRTTVLDRVWPTRPKRTRRVRHVLADLGIAHRAKATVAELSGGETQRAALAQLELLSAKLIAGDEFVANLDPGMTISILHRFNQAIIRAGGAGLVALHDVHAAMQVADTILLLWPTSVDSTPWAIPAGGAAWSTDVVHTALCISRWLAVSDPSECIRQFVRVFQDAVEDHRQQATLATQFTVSPAAFLQEDGTIVPAQGDLLEQINVERSHQGPHSVSPIRVEHDNRVAIGVSFAGHECGRPVTLCVDVKNGQ